MSKVWDKQHGGSHYQKYKIQPSKFVVENELLYPEGCAIKYIIRHQDKNGKEDLLKAIHFIEMIIERDFALIRKKTDPDRLIYIRKILNKGYDDGEVRVKYANIHTVKGLTFDNVVVDLTATREEDYFTQLRLKYVAYSRGKFDCWTVASQGKYTLGNRTRLTTTEVDKLLGRK